MNNFHEMSENILQEMRNMDVFQEVWKVVLVQSFKTDVNSGDTESNDGENLYMVEDHVE